MNGRDRMMLGILPIHRRSMNQGDQESELFGWLREHGDERINSQEED